MFAANLTGGTINITIGGRLVPLPTQDLDGFTVNPANTTFQVPTSGRYYITYDINLLIGVAPNAKILRNGVPIPASVRSSLVARSYGAGFIVTLAAGDTISLELSGVIETILLQDGVGVSLTIIRLS